MKANKTYQSYLKRNTCKCEYETLPNNLWVKIRTNGCNLHKRKELKSLTVKDYVETLQLMRKC